MRDDDLPGPTPGDLASPRAGEPPRRRSSTGRRHSAAREQVLRAVEAQHAPVSIPALSRSTGLHENTVRGHLDQLLADGYVTRTRGEATGRGRPAWLWRAASDEPSTPYAALTGVLARTIVATSANPMAVAREAGRAWGRDLRADLVERGDGADLPGRERVVRTMREQGFGPVDAGEDILLTTCPLLEAAARHPDVVCAVHAGMVDALLEDAEPDPHEPLRAELQPFAEPGLCRLRLLRPPSPAARRRTSGQDPRTSPLG